MSKTPYKNFRKEVYADMAIQEASGWLRELEFMLMEVSFLKTRLSHVVDNATAEQDVKQAEQFQENFIQFDEKVKSFLAELKKHHETMVFDKTHFPAQTSDLKDVHQSYRERAELIIAEWSGLRKHFNSWVINLIWPG